jgi:hypothetical protein
LDLIFSAICFPCSYAAVSGEAIAVTLLVVLLSRKLTDRTLVLLGMVFSGASLTAMVIRASIYLACSLSLF